MVSVPIVKIAPNNPVFDLPVIVGIEEGLFAKAGLDVSFSATYDDRERDNATTPFMSRLKEQLFDCGSADSYNVCEWASIDRLERGTRGGKLAALRAAVAAQAIVTFDETLQVPRDLADVPVWCRSSPARTIRRCRCSKARSAPSMSRSCMAACRRCATPGLKSGQFAPSR